MHYYGTRLSENISLREPEGYLLCMNVPVARTGIQEYLPEELGLQPAAGSSYISVYRPEGEVFSPEAIASFEGMPVTDGHPAEGVDVWNIRELQKGHAHNVRRGSGPEADLLLADLIITDPALIDRIMNGGKREISCGYTYELCEEGGRYIQRRIRGNHVAVVDAGRAGARVSIRDSLQDNRERSNNTMKKSLSKVLARIARDGDAETVAEIIEEMLEPAQAAPGEAGTPGAEEAEEAEERAGRTETAMVPDEEGIAGICERLDRIIALLEPAAADESAAEQTSGTIGETPEAGEGSGTETDPVVEEMAEIVAEALEPVLDPETEEEGGEDEEGNGEERLSEFLEGGDALRAALSAVRPVLARMPLKTRRKMAGDIAARIRRNAAARTADASVYAALVSAGRRTAPSSADLGRRIMAARNANYRK